MLYYIIKSCAWHELLKYDKLISKIVDERGALEK